MKTIEKAIQNPETKKSKSCTLVDVLLPAGFPSPADDHMENSLDLNEYLVKHPAATFFIRVEGDSMVGAGIHSGDMLIVDRSLSALNGKIIVALVDGEFTVKKMIIKGKKLFLASANPRYPTICIADSSLFQVWGVVTYVIHRPS